MMGKRILTAAATLVLWVVAGRALAQDAEFIEYEGRLVNPGRILARALPGVDAAKSGLPTAAQAAAKAGMYTARSFKTIPGLVVLEGLSDKSGKAPKSKADQAGELKARIEALRASGAFAYVATDDVYRSLEVPTDSRFADGTLWGLNNTGQLGGVPGVDVGALAAWEITTGSRDTVIAVIDSGVMHTHRDLRANMWVNPGEIPGNGVDDDGNGYIDDVHGINAVTGTGDPMDDDGHGTHVAGTIGAVANNGFGHVGVAWEVQIMGLKFIRASGFGILSDAIECLDYAVAMGAKVSNNSWGGGGFNQALLDAITRAREAGHLFIAAAGNDASDNDSTPAYPASYPLDNIISVAAIDRKGIIADFSNYGRRSVHVAAPGVEIYSTYIGSDTAYDSLQGTSMASPHVAGVAALILSAAPDADYIEIRERILSTVTKLPELAGRVITDGLVNAAAALDGKADGILEVSLTPPPDTSLLVNATNILTIRVSDLKPITNATITATFSGAIEGPATFLNDGTDPDLVADDALYTTSIIATNLGRLELYVEISAPDAVTFTNTYLYNVFDRPENDTYATPAKIPAGFAEMTDDNTLATLEEGEPNHAGTAFQDASLWYAWPAAATGPVLVDLAGTAFDSIIAVYTGSNLRTARRIVSADNVDGRRNPHVIFDAVAGTTYRFAVASAGEARGRVRLRMIPNGAADTTSPLVAITSHLNGFVSTTNRIVVAGTAFDPGDNPSGVVEVRLGVNGSLPRAVSGREAWSQPVSLRAGLNRILVQAVDDAENVSSPVTITVDYRPQTVGNDHFVNATILTGTSGSVEGSNESATLEPSEPAHAGLEGGKSVWWRYTAPGTGLLRISTRDTRFDTLMGVYTGDRLSRLVPVASNDDARRGVSFSEVNTAVEAGKTYQIAVDGFAGQSGNLKLIYEFTPTNLFRLELLVGEGGTVDSGGGLFGPGQTATLRATPSPGFRFLRWDADTVRYDNPLEVRMSNHVTVAAVFRRATVTDDFESGDFSRLDWTSAGDAGWTVASGDSSSGDRAARSGAIGDGQSSSLRLQARTWPGAGRFRFKVSSEAGWDSLQFWVNGVLQQEWSGEVPWSTFNFQLASGVNQLEWRYRKDSQRGEGSDAAWLDDLVLPIVPAVSSDTPADLSLLSTSGSQAQIRLVGQVDQRYVVEASSDLRLWTPVSTNIAVDGEYLVRDPIPLNRPNRVYRAVAR